MNEKFAEIAKCSADHNDVSSTASPDIESEVQGHVMIAASSVSVVSVFLITTVAVVAAILIYKRTTIHSSRG